MAPAKRMLARWTPLLLYLLSHYTALTVSQNITITGVYLLGQGEPVSVVAADSAATTFAGTTVLTVTFSGLTTSGGQVSSFTGSQSNTLIETFVIGPSTAVYIEEIPNALSYTDACILTRSLSQGCCFLATTAQITAPTTTLETLFETYTIPSLDFDFKGTLTVTAGQEKLLFDTTTTTSSAPSVSSTRSTIFATSTSSLSAIITVPITTSIPLTSSIPSASSISLTSSIPPTSSIPLTSSSLSASSIPSATSTSLINSTSLISYIELTSSPPSITSPIPTDSSSTSNPASNSSAVSTNNIAPTTTPTPALAIPIPNRATLMHDTRYLRSTVVGFIPIVMVAMFLCL